MKIAISVGIRCLCIGLSALAHGHDLKASVGQSFNDALRYLLGFPGIHPVVWVIISGIANRRGNYRIHLVLISHHHSPTSGSPFS
jgi:hypothetical protein